MWKVLQTVCMVTVLVTDIVNAQGEVTSMCIQD